MRAEQLETDVLVIGGGAAGCTAALRIHELGAKPLVIVKGKMGRSGATPLASMLSAPSPPRLPMPVLKAAARLYSAITDAIPLPMPAFYRAAMMQMLSWHYWLVDQEYFLDAGLWAQETFFPSLEARGLYVVRDENGAPVVPKGNIPSYILQSHGMTGYQYGESKRKEVLATNIKVMEETMALRFLYGKGGEVVGATVLDYKTGRLYAVRAKATILATGHTNWLSTRSTGTREMAANGLALAARAGAELQNLEIQWFHASDLASPASWMRLHHYPNPLSGSDHRVAMVNSDGQEYMRAEEYNTSMPYTIQMKKLYEQVRAGKASWDHGSFADFGRVEPALLEKYQYHWEFYKKLGKDMARGRHEAGITWHMSAGGVRANVETMETGIPGLFIAGAVGGHMLGGLHFATYDGQLAGTSAARYATARALLPVDAQHVRAQEEALDALLATARAPIGTAISPIEAKKRIRAIVWDNMMFAKNGQTLRRALTDLAAAREEIMPKVRLRTATPSYNTDLVDALDVEDMIDVCEMAAQASLLREESRGPHFREDFPYTDNENWLKHIVLSRRDGRVEHRFAPIRQKYIQPEKQRIDYLRDPYA